MYKNKTAKEEIKVATLSNMITLLIFTWLLSCLLMIKESSHLLTPPTVNSLVPSPLMLITAG